MKTNPKYHRLFVSGVVSILLSIVFDLISLFYYNEYIHVNVRAYTSIYLFKWKIGYSSWRNIYFTLCIGCAVIALLLFVFGINRFLKRKNTEQFIE